MPDVFLSYCHDDQSAARRFAGALEDEGFEVWWDDVLNPGEAFDQVTEAALRAARAVVVLWTHRSVASRWVRSEATQAARYGTLVPVALEPCDRPIQFGLTHTADLAGWNGDRSDARWRSFVERLRKFVARPDAGATGTAEVPAAPAPPSPPASTSRPSRKLPLRALAASVTVIAIIAIAFALLRDRAAGGSIAQLAELVRRDDYGTAFRMALQMRERSGMDKGDRFRELWNQIVLPMIPLVSEDGATVWFKPYNDAGDWIKAGVTPITTPVDAPSGVLRVKVEKPGFRTGYFAISNPGLSVKTDMNLLANASPTMREALETQVPLPLVKEGTLEEGMVIVPASEVPVHVNQWTTSVAGTARQFVPAFAVSRTEVTNAEYQRFVDAGGYDNPAYWQDLTFLDGGRELTWDEAKLHFVDSTGKPGPRQWKFSRYPEGDDDLPVGGISWYEARAYARFSGKELPTVHHWARYAFSFREALFPTAPTVALASRFSASGPAPAGDDVGPGPWGTVHTAGNVREWVYNATGTDRLALGGAWNDYASLYAYALNVPPMDRSPENGLRLMQLLPGTPVNEALYEPIQLLRWDELPGRKPVNNEQFEMMRLQFTTSRGQPLKTTVEQVQETSRWTAERVVLDFADGQQVLYIVLPKGAQERLQAVVYAPPGDCCIGWRPNDEAIDFARRAPADIVVMSGRALVIPIWENSFERVERDPPVRSVAETQDRDRRMALSWYQDLDATLDYLETRSDIDPRRVALLAMSYGATTIAPIVLAIEGRIKAAVFISGGLRPEPPTHPMRDPLNYLPRITIPVLMINGRYDQVFGYDSSRKHMYDLLGTPATDKKQVPYEVGHFAYPPNSLAKDVGGWLDTHLGPSR